jgi:hypothetical protein
MYKLLGAAEKNLYRANKSGIKFLAERIRTGYVRDSEKRNRFNLRNFVPGIMAGAAFFSFYAFASIHY